MVKRKLQNIHQTWRRFLVRLFIDCLLLISRILAARRGAHWIGYFHRRRRRFERPMIPLLFLSAMLLLEPREYALWSAICGAVTAFLLPFLCLHYQLTCLLREVD